MRKELEKAYQPQDIEPTIYRTWEKSGMFNPNKLPGKRTKTFSVAMPPPNVTGDLHLGHATGLTIEDIMVRFHRMNGVKSLFIPGTDHAGIATQVMVERLIAKSGLNKHKLGRDKFVKQVWDWKNQYGSRITKQIRQLGISCDWSREHFTMDPDLTKAVQAAFIKMFNDGLIYRGDRIVNWCTRCNSALSDLEVKHSETTGKLWYIRYPLFGSTKYVTVATTRPETMLGDTAVAVNPDDKRYKNYIGKTVLIPIMDREVPIIADRRVDSTFGTGVVKVTPAHDHLDYEIGIDHKLDIINVISQEGRMTKAAGEFFGKSMQAARHSVIKRLEEDEMLEKTVDYVHNQSRCDRCSAPISPLISKQWFVNIKPLAKKAIAAVKTGKITIVPKRFDKVYFHWMNNIKDWCISRQLWWGHQIPVWYRDEDARASATQPRGKGWTQDPDTLDTWFSSGLWTFSTLGWPKKTSDLKNYHPTSVMETGWDLLFFWVARMIMMSLYFTGEVPFKTVYLHGLVLDQHGKKMSKSKGTGVDPIPMAERYGTDAIRLSITLGTSAGQDFRLYEEKIAGYRNFINKLWNISRFILSKDSGEKKRLEVNTLADQWIVSRAQQLIINVTKKLESFKFSEAGTELYEFVWHEFADWYVEISKQENNESVLQYILEVILKLGHPFMPYVTEEIWSRWQGGSDDTLLMVQPWPKAEKKLLNKNAEINLQLLKELIITLRNYRAEKKIPFDAKLQLSFWGKNEKLIIQNREIIARLAHVKDFYNEKRSTVSFSLPGVDFYLHYELEESEKEIKIQKISKYIQKIEEKLSNKNFVSKAPPELVEKEREKLKEQQDTLKKLL